MTPFLLSTMAWSDLWESFAEPNTDAAMAAYTSALNDIIAAKSDIMVNIRH